MQLVSKTANTQQIRRFIEAPVPGRGTHLRTSSDYASMRNKRSARPAIRYHLGPLTESRMRLLAPAFSAALLTFTNAQALTLADARARNATQLSVTELRQLMPGAKVVSHEEGSTRVWANKVNGTLVASTDSQNGSGFGRDVVSGAAQGTWGIGEEGTYCVSIQWSSNSEDWCRYVFKLGDKYYGFDSIEKSASGSELEFSK